MALNLESVEQAFIADLTRYLDALDAGIAKAEQFAEANKAAQDAVAGIGVTATDVATVVDAALGSMTNAANQLKEAFLQAAAAAQGLRGTPSGGGGLPDLGFGGIAEETEQAKAAAMDLMRIAQYLKDTFGVVTQTEREAFLTGRQMEQMNEGLRLSFAGVTQSTRGMIPPTDEARRSIAETAAVAATAAPRFRLWGTGIWFTANALHWLVMGTLEIASTAVPALLAFGAAALAMQPTFTGIFDRMNALVIASGSMRMALLNSIGPLHQLGLSITQTQLAVQPDAFIIFGSAIRDVTSHLGAFSGMARSAANILATFATDITSFLTGSGGKMLTSFFANGAGFMRQWIQTLGDLGITFLNVVNSMWGVGHLILDVLNAIARALAAITSTKLGAWAIGLIAAFSALYRFGTLALGAAKAMGILDASLVIPKFFQFVKILGTAAAEMATVALTTGDLTVAWGAFTDTLAMSEVAAGPLLAVMAVIAAGLGAWWVLTRHATTASDNLIASVQKQPPTIQNLTHGIIQLSAAQQKQIGVMHQLHAQMMQTHSMVGNIPLSQPYQLATLNVQKLTNAIIQQRQKLLSLETGLAQTGAGVGVVGHYMNMLSIDTSLADSKVQQMNQAFSDFMSNVTGGEGGLATFAQSLANITSVQATTGINNLGRSTSNATLSVKQFAQQLSLGAVKGAGAWNNFVQIVSSTMPNLVNWLNIARTEGALTSSQFSKAVLDMASSMIKYAKTSPPAQAALVAFAQASGKNIHTFPQLVRAIKESGANMGDLTKKVDSASIAMGNAAQMAQNLSAALSSQMSQSIAKAELQQSGFNSALKNYIAAQGGAIVKGHDAAYWLQIMTGDYQAATTNSLAAGKAMSASADHARAAIKSTQDQLKQFANMWHALQSKSLTLTVNIAQHGGIVLPGMPLGTRLTGMAEGSSGARRGPAIVGEKGPELVYMRGGEQVIPAHHTRAMLQVAGSLANLTGYQHGTGGGGPAGGGSTGGSGSLQDKLDDELAALAARLLGAKSISSINQFINNLLSTVRQLAKAGGMDHEQEADIVRQIRNDNEKLDALSRARDKILARIHKAEQYARNVSQTAQATASLSTIMGTAGNGPVTSSFLLASMKIDLAGIRKFDADIKKLEHMGLDRNLLNQIIQMGPAQGDVVAQALINGPLSNIKALNATESQVQRASRNLGRGAANRMFDSGKEAGEGFLSGLKAQEHKLEAEMRHLADVMVKTLRRELGLGSGDLSGGSGPGGHHHHRGVHAAGVAAIRAFTFGARDTVPFLASAVRGTGHLPPALAAAAGGGGGGVIEIHNHIEITGPDAKQLFRVTQPQALRVDRRNGANHLSLRRGRGG